MNEVWGFRRDGAVLPAGRLHSRRTGSPFATPSVVQRETFRMNGDGGAITVIMRLLAVVISRAPDIATE